MHFLYVFTKADRDRLLKEGFKLLKSDKKSDVYIFENIDEGKGNSKHVFDTMEHVLSDTLSF